MEIVNWIQSCGTVGLVIATVIYVLITRKTITEMKFNRTYALPIVYFDVKREESQQMEIVLKNFGPGPAINLRTEFSEEIPNVSNLPMWSQLRFLAPGEELRSIFGRAFEYFKNPENPTKTKITIGYEEWGYSSKLRKRRISYEMDLSGFQKIRFKGKESITETQRKITYNPKNR